MRHNPELGITDPYELNREQFDAALDLLRQQRQIVARYWHDAYVQMDDFKNEGVVASSSWPFQVNLLEAEGQPIASVIPAGRRDRLGGYHHDARRCSASQLRLQVAGALAQSQAAGRPGCLVRFRAGCAGCLQWERAARRGRLQDQWDGQFR